MTVDKPPFIKLAGVSRIFGGVKAVNDVSFDLRAGEIVGLIGPNGAGKTTLVNLISGFDKPNTGSITYDGKVISGSKPHHVAASGIARTFQIVQPFSRMTVLENVMAGSLYAGKCGMADAQALALECLEFVKLASFASVPAAELALANRKRLELAKSLAMKPRFLMLDEVNAGLNSSEIDEAIRMVAGDRRTRCDDPRDRASDAGSHGAHLAHYRPASWRARLRRPDRRGAS